MIICVSAWFCSFCSSAATGAAPEIVQITDFPLPGCNFASALRASTQATTLWGLCQFSCAHCSSGGEGYELNFSKTFRMTCGLLGETLEFSISLRGVLVLLSGKISLFPGDRIFMSTAALKGLIWQKLSPVVFQLVLSILLGVESS